MKIVKEFRAAIDTAKEEGEFDEDICFHHFPRGCCGDASDLLAQYLLDNNVTSWYGDLKMIVYDINKAMTSLMFQSLDAKLYTFDLAVKIVNTFVDEWDDVLCKGKQLKFIDIKDHALSKIDVYILEKCAKSLLDTIETICIFTNNKLGIASD